MEDTLCSVQGPINIFGVPYILKQVFNGVSDVNNEKAQNSTEFLDI